MHGFDASDGFNLHHVDEWTPGQKAKIRAAVKRITRLRAQPKIINHPRKKSDLVKGQKVFHGSLAHKDFKVVFVPYHQPVLALPGAKKRRPRVRYLKTGVSVSNGIYDRIFVLFNKKRLAANAMQEIKRAAKEMPKASLFYVAVDENVTANGKSLSLLIPEILKLMEQYDGVKPLPRGSGNTGDSPVSHHWARWLNGLAGYHIYAKGSVRKLGALIRQGREANQERKRTVANLMKRKTVKGR